MTALSSLTGINDLLVFNQLTDLKWTKNPITYIKRVHLICLHKRLEMQRGKIFADTAMTEFADFAMTQWVTGSVDQNEVMHYVPPRLPYSVTEFLDTFDRFKPAESSAILVAYLEKMSLSEVATLRWSDVRQRSFLPETIKVLEAQPRQLRADWVFWEQTDSGRQQPILNLKDRFAEIEGRSWSEFINDSRSIINDMRQSKEVVNEILNIL